MLESVCLRPNYSGWIVNACPEISLRIFCAALNTAASEARNAALNALMSISFDNANNCLLIAHTSGMLQSLLKGLYSGSDESRDGFCGVLCNVIYYNKEATRLVLGRQF